MRQQSFAAEDFEIYRKKTRKEKFLEEMESIIPWAELSEVIEPYYPVPAKAGRPPVGIDRMLRIHFLQHWFELSDPAAEEALYDSRAMRQFVGIDLGKEPVPDETTILNFRHLRYLSTKLSDLIMQPWPVFALQPGSLWVDSTKHFQSSPSS